MKITYITDYGIGLNSSPNILAYGDKRMARTTIKAAKEKWADNVKDAKERNKYRKGVAEFLGVSPDEIVGLPAKHWDEFAEEAEAYKDKYEKGLKRAYTTRP